MQNTFPTKFQHLVLFAKDLVQSHQWYRKVFDLQFSAQNDPDGSAAMNAISQSMHFFSFGYYHHDLALCKRRRVKPDNTSIVNYAMRLRDSTTIADFSARLMEQKVSYKHGRVLKSAKIPDGLQAISFKDPNGYWIEVIGK